MVFFWRGAGIFVLIFFLICAWLTSYAFVDTRLGNGSFIGWSMVWTAIPTIILYFVIKNWPESEPAPGEIQTKSTHWGHSFMFIPVIIWPVVFLGGGLYLINVSAKEQPESNTHLLEETVLEGERIINFWNPSEETLTMSTFFKENGQERMSEDIEAGKIVYGIYDADEYSFQYKNRKRNVSIQGSTINDTLSYDQAWFILDHKIDLLLVDVSLACSDKINETELRAIDWKEKIIDRFKGGQLIEPIVKSSDGKTKQTVIEPGFQLPLSIGESEIIYALIPIHRDSVATESVLDDEVVELCY
jgi:hypothetical protein